MIATQQIKSTTTEPAPYKNFEIIIHGKTYVHIC